MSELPVEDGLVVPVVGSWAKRKYHFLGRYLDAFTTAMRSKWTELHYLDLFAGAGLARVRGTGELLRASPLLAATVRYPFTQLHLSDADPSNVAALTMRLGRLSLPRPARAVLGDANTIIDELIRPIPRRDALCMTFVDPFGLHFDFETLTALAALNTDLVVLFADNMDALRNWAAYYDHNRDSNLDRFLGEPGWREVLRSTPPERQAERLRAHYRERVRRFGFDHWAEVRVQNDRDRDIYTLLYLSRSAVGLKIWHGTSAKDEGGQMSLSF